MKSYGRAPTFLLRTGYEQVRSVAAALAGDLESAREVELVLPETGVCNGPPRRQRPRRRRRVGRAAAANRPGGCERRDTGAPTEGERRTQERPAGRAAGAPAWRTRAWAIVGALSVTETVSWGILYYAFAVFLLPMQHDLGFSRRRADGRVLDRPAGLRRRRASPSAGTSTATAHAG